MCTTVGHTSHIHAAGAAASPSAVAHDHNALRASGPPESVTFTGAHAEACAAG